MSRDIAIDYSKVLSFVTEQEIRNFKDIVLQAKSTLLDKSGIGNDYLGWVDLPENYDKEEFARIKKAAAKIGEDS